VDKAREFGLDVKTQSELTNITKGDDFTIETTNGTVKAKIVINAAGVCAPFLGQLLDLDIPIQPRQGYILVTTRQEQDILRNLMNKFGKERIADERTSEHGVALVHEPTESQNFLNGSSRQFVGYDSSIDIRVVETIANRAMRFFPKLDDVNIIRSYTGFRPF